MSDSPPAQPTTETPSPGSAAAPSAAPSSTTAPDGRATTLLTEQPNASGTTEPATETKTETETSATPFDAAKLTFPDDFGKPDAGMLEKFAEIAKSANLSQEAAQQLANLHTETSKAASEANLQAWSRTIEAWETEIKSDPVIGGDKLEGVKASVAKVVQDPRFATPGFIEALNLTGFGSNPAAVRFFAKIASALTEGSAVQGSPPGPPQRTAAQRMYPNNPSSEAAGD